MARLPFASARSRVQGIMHAGGFTSSAGGTITHVELRRDQGDQQFNHKRVDLRMRLGVPATTAATMSPRFQANWSGAPTTVWSGLISMPTQLPVPAGPGPWNAVIPLSASYAWDGGDLAYELEVVTNLTSGGYDLDAVVQPPPSGTASRFGAACAGPQGVPFYPTPDPTRLLPGGSIDNELRGGTPGAMAFHVLGDDAMSWAGIPLPFTWPGSSCTVYTNVVVAAARVLDPAGGASVSWALPASPAIGGAIAYGQWAIAEAPGVFPPLTLTDAHRLVVGRPQPVLFETIGNVDGAETGTKWPLGHVGLVMRLVLH